MNIRPKRLKSWPLPKKRTREENEKIDPLPQPDFFGRDDFMRARFFSALIERYTTKAETEVFVAYARERRMPGMSFADTLEAMGSFMHLGPPDAKDKLLAQMAKPKEQVEREFLLTEALRDVMRTDGPDSSAVYKVLVNALRKLYPGAIDERIKGAIEAGNSKDGFSVPAVIEAMTLTEPLERCAECKGTTVMTQGHGLDTQIKVCSLWKAPGHLDAVDIEMRVRDIKKQLRPSGRFA